MPSRPSISTRGVRSPSRARASEPRASCPFTCATSKAGSHRFRPQLCSERAGPTRPALCQYCPTSTLAGGSRRLADRSHPGPANWLCFAQQPPRLPAKRPSELALFHTIGPPPLAGGPPELGLFCTPGHLGIGFVLHNGPSAPGEQGSAELSGFRRLAGMSTSLVVPKSSELTVLPFGIHL